MAYDAPRARRGAPPQRRLGAARAGGPRRPAAERGRAGVHRARRSAGAGARATTCCSSRRRPDAVASAFNDSPPASPAGWSRSTARWSDCDGDVERRFSKDELCDFLTMYWATGTIASSMRLYWAERARPLAPRARRADQVPAAVADFPARDRARAARVGGAHPRRPPPLDRDAARRPLRGLRGAGAARRRRDRVPRPSWRVRRGEEARRRALEHELGRLVGDEVADAGDQLDTQVVGVGLDALEQPPACMDLVVGRRTGAASASAAPSR